MYPKTRYACVLKLGMPSHASFCRNYVVGRNLYAYHFKIYIYVFNDDKTSLLLVWHVFEAIP